MNLREVREAADRLRNGWHSQSPKLLGDYETVCDFVLATIDPSPDEPITAEWLREVWGFEEYSVYGSVTRLCVAVGEIMVRMHPHTDGWDCYGDDFELPNLLTTRQQFCDLARCLGIPRKQPKPEPEGCTCLSSPNMLNAPCSYCDKQRKDGAE